MRLSNKELEAINSGFKQALTSYQYRIYLFGSRANPNKKGGDIDLLLVCSEKDKMEIAQLKSKIRFLIFDQIEEQKIDITVATESELNSDLFLQSIRDDLVLIDE